MNLRDSLQGVYDQHGKLTPVLVLDQARDESHPLHNHFEWDDTAAGEKWRLHQAHELIRKVKVTTKEAEADEALRPGVRKWHAVKGNGPESYVYEPAEKIAADPFLFKLLVREMETAIKVAQRKQDEFIEYVQRIAGSEEQRDAA